MHKNWLRITLAALTFASLSAGAARAATLKETFSQAYPFAAGGTLTLRNVNGAVTLDAWDRNEVRIEADKEVKAGSDADAKKIMDQVKIDIQTASGGLRVDTKIPKRDTGFLGLFGNNANVNVTYRVHLPRRATVDAGTVNGAVALSGTQGPAKLDTTNGSIKIHGVDGDLDLGTTNGSVEAAGVTGTVKADTTNGRIDLQFAHVPSRGDSKATTTNGGVTIKMPHGAGVEVDAETTNGRVESDFQVAGGQSGKRHLSGAINGGGSKLHISTTNGGVRLVEG